MAPDGKNADKTRYVTTNVEKVTPVPESSPPVATFEQGYDQGVREVMEEVWRRDPMLAAELVEKYPVWAEIIAGCNNQ